MRTTRIVIARDKKYDTITVFQGDAKIYMLGSRWLCDDASTKSARADAQRFQCAFGFLPRKGSKKMYELREVQP
jgi:hypothetical protein